MAAAITITIDGAKEVAARLQAISRDVAAKVIENAALQGAEPLVTEIKGNTPVFLDRLRPGMDKQLQPRDGGERAVVHVGPTRRGFVARFLEFGTSKMSARPFIRPSLERSRARVLSAFNASVTLQLERIAGALST